ncbi:hypothetical protein V5799_010372 [Amblyomma americanum]|uniref:Uncharacterized protein n=1 Tax=Amblyomma americanum TaxID=6943 RepID=A0AAQ4EJZ7_AMBAM
MKLGKYCGAEMRRDETKEAGAIRVHIATVQGIVMQHELAQSRIGRGAVEAALDGAQRRLTALLVPDV